MTTPHHDCGCDHSHPQSKYEQALSHYDLHLHDEQVAEAVRRLLDEHKAEYDTDEVKRQLIGTLELTSLKVTDSAESILALTERVNDFADAHPDLPHLATICVYPNFAQIVSQSLQADGIEVACVAGGFPSSQTFAEIKTAETALAVHDGATEIDCVMSVGAYLSGDYETLCDEIAEIKAACADRHIRRRAAEHDPAGGARGSCEVNMNIKEMAAQLEELLVRVAIIESKLAALTAAGQEEG